MSSQRLLHAGDEIQLETKSGLFRGRVHLKNADRIYLGKIVDLNTGLSLPGLRCFLKKEVISSKFVRGNELTSNVSEQIDPTSALKLEAIRIFSEPSEKDAVSEKPREVRSDHENVEKKENESVDSLNDSVDIRMISKISQLKKVIEDCKSSHKPMQLHSQEVANNAQERISNSPAVDKTHFRNNYVVIDAIDSIFYNSIADLKHSRSIGMAFIGSDIEKGTDFSWVVVHAKDFYLYDVMSLGDLAFVEGLKDVLHDENVVKIVFDCRVASHTLLHKHKSLMTNVIDLMAFEVMANSFAYPSGGVSRKMNSLVTCVAGNLSPSVVDVYSQKNRLEKAKNDNQYWNLRMRGTTDRSKEEFEDMLQALIFEVAHLKKLKQALTKKMMSPVIDATDVLLGSFRDATKLQLLPKDATSTPKEFHDRSVLSHAAESCRNKMTELMESMDCNGSNVTESIDKLLGASHCIMKKVTNRGFTSYEDEVPSSSETSDSKSDCSSNGSSYLLSALMAGTEDRRVDADITFAPCGAEIGYKPSTKLKNMRRGNKILSLLRNQ